MKTLQKKIEKIMDEKIGERFSLSASGFYFLSLFYGVAIKVKDKLWQQGIFSPKKVSCPVISIGNICVGGTGKTPMTLYTAKMLKETGYRVCVLSRGYKGASENKGGIVTDGKTLLMDAKTAGDEACLMARTLTGVPVLVGKDRLKSAGTAISMFSPDVLILDDGFQHRKLFRDIDVVLLDHQEPFGNHRLLPAGRLREPVSALSRAHVVVLTRSANKKHIDPTVKAWAAGGNRPVFHASHQPFPVGKIVAPGSKKNPNTDQQTWQIDVLKGKSVFAFSGIANNDRFRKTIETLGGRVVGFASFPDHHPYSEKELQQIAASAARARADLIVTTQKDDVRIPPDMTWPAEYGVIGIEMCLPQDADAYKAFILEKIAAAEMR
jgi:tetraacyldisaccharide 4'-kinase